MNPNCPLRSYIYVVSRNVTILLSVASVILIAAVVWMFRPDIRRVGTSEPPPSQASEKSRLVLSEPTIQTEGGPAVHPVSIPAFARQQFDGSDFTVGRVLADNGVYTRYYITYKSGELKISGIMNVPKGTGPFPLLVLNHGYIDPAVYTNGRGLKREQDYLARQGYVVVHPDYRNHADSDKDPTVEHGLRLGYAEDVINAIKAVRSAGLSYVDGERVGMLGHSLGGGIALTVAVAQPDLVDAIVLFAPVSADARDNFERWTTRRPEVAQAIIAEYGLSEENPRFWDDISPIKFFDQVEVPILIHHGTVDEDVPLRWSERTAQALKGVGKDVTLEIYPGEPHEFIDAWPTVMARTTDLFDRYLK